jgi:hypothetical protein
MPNLTAVLEGRRDAREASLSGGVFAGVPGDGVSVIESVVAGRMDWAVQPNLVLGAWRRLSWQDQYLGAGRTDRAISPLASVKYFASRYLTLGFDYRYLNFRFERARHTGLLPQSSICSPPREDVAGRLSQRRWKQNGAPSMRPRSVFL